MIRQPVKNCKNVKLEVKLRLGKLRTRLGQLTGEQPTVGGLKAVRL